MNPEPLDVKNFPTLAKYPSDWLEDSISKLMKKFSMTRQQCLVNLEQDLSEMECYERGNKKK